MYPKAIQNLINEFSKLPSVGPKTAERLVFYLLYGNHEELEIFAKAAIELKQHIKTCSTCFNFSETDPCPTCADPRRNFRQICVVAKPQDIAVIEKTGSFSGLYHILGNYLNPLENIKPRDIKVRELITRLQTGSVEEVILALNPDLKGEATTIYLSKLIKQTNSNIKISRPARGLPMGADLEYADEITMENAFKGRQELK